MKTNFLLLMAIFIMAGAFAFASVNDSTRIRVHFLHGSKPKKKFRYVEDRWFGGLLGGHVGVEYENNRILDFVPKARFHLFAKKQIINSRFAEHDTISFYRILGGEPDSNKKTIVTIFIGTQQKETLDSLVLAYKQHAPYDYAFFGMRCGAAAYDVLAHTGIVKQYTFGKTWRKVFYPRKLRRTLEHLARARHYPISKYPGCTRRKWEKD